MPQSTEASPVIVTAQSLGSGSSGNALLVTAGETTLLIDCGVGIRSIRAAFAERGRSLRDLSALLITHEHRDHVQTLPAVLHPELPIVATSGTARAASLPREQTTVIAPNLPISMCGATVHCLPTRHDAAEPCGFLVELAGVTIAVMTDLGIWQDHLAEAANSSDLVLIEANYNDIMLQHGPYPAYLKRRVASGVGHLANAACGQAIAPIAKYRGVKTTWWLSHLSKTNNTPDQALVDVQECVRRHNADASITPLPRQAQGPHWQMTARPSPLASHRQASPPLTQIIMPGLD